MDSHQETIKLLNTFGMNGKKAAEIMDISYTIFRQKKGKLTGNSFSDENYEKLAGYIKEKAKQIKK